MECCFGTRPSVTPKACFQHQRHAKGVLSARRSKQTAILEARFITNRRDQRRCGNRTDRFDLTDALTHLIRTEERLDPRIVAVKTCVQFGQVFAHVTQQIDKEFPKVPRQIVCDFVQGATDAVYVARQRDTMFPKQSSDLVHTSCTACEHRETDAVDRQDFKLLWRFWRHKPHRRSANSVANRFRVTAIIRQEIDPPDQFLILLTVRFDVGRHELSRDQPDLLPQTGQNTRPVVRWCDPQRASIPTMHGFNAAKN